MWSKTSSLKSWAVLILSAGLMGAGCSGAKEPMMGGSTSGTGGGAGEEASGAGGTAGDNASGAGGASGAGSSAGAGGSSGAGGAGAGGGGTGGSGAGGAGGTDEPEVLDPAVDWTAYDLVYDVSYTAYDGVHTYQLPIYVMDTEFELSDWQAIPSTAVTFEEDPENGGVLVTIVEPVEEITIAVSSGMLGGSAPIHVTIGTPEEWEMGEARYKNGVEYTIPNFDFAALLDPNFMPPEPPGDLACNNCHTTGAKYFEIQHSPTQAAHFSDEELITILTDGMKPAGVGYRILPMMLEHLYADFHTWESDATEQKGLIMYMRSLTPTGQGDIKLPDGSYVPVGTEPMLPAMP